MKSIILIIVGIVLGIITIKAAVACVASILAFAISAAIIKGVVALGCGALTAMCFNKI